MGKPGQMGDEFLKHLHDTTKEKLRGKMDDKQAEKIASEMVADASFHFAGQQLYMPLRSKYIETLIKRDFTGDNVPELVAKYRVSRAQIYKILGKKESRKASPQQARFPGC